MIINSGEPWLMWPDKVSYQINKGNIGDTFEGETDFTLAMNIKILTKSETKRTIFAKLPNYCGIDLEPNNHFLLILKLLKNDEETYKYIVSDESINDDFNILMFRYSKFKRLISVSINENVVVSYYLDDDESLTVGHEPHIIFGAGNFPHNNFNLNYCSYDMDFLLISKTYMEHNEIISTMSELNNTNSVALFDFKEHTDYKVYDLTGNCNFLHKIIE